MTVDIIQVPSLIELSLFNEERKADLLQHMFTMYVEKIEELSLYAPQEVINIANGNADMIAEEIQDGAYLKLYPWKLYKFYENIRSHYSDLVVLVGRYKKSFEAQERYQKEIKDKINILEGIENYINEHKELSAYFGKSVESFIVQNKQTLVNRQYSKQTFDALVDECNGLIQDYLDIINTFKEQEQEGELNGIDSVIAQAKNEGKQERKEATDNASDGVDMYKRLQNLRNKSED